MCIKLLRKKGCEKIRRDRESQPTLILCKGSVCLPLMFVVIRVRAAVRGCLCGFEAEKVIDEAGGGAGS